MLALVFTARVRMWAAMATPSTAASRDARREHHTRHRSSLVHCNSSIKYMDCAVLAPVQTYPADLAPR
jgi:hypothetical protein